MEKQARCGCRLGLGSTVECQDEKPCPQGHRHGMRICVASRFGLRHAEAKLPPLSTCELIWRVRNENLQPWLQHHSATVSTVPVRALSDFTADAWALVGICCCLDSVNGEAMTICSSSSDYVEPSQ